MMYKRRLSIIPSILLAICAVLSCYPRCKIKSCHTRKVHTHGGKTVRGNPWYFRQNPGTGESDSPLIRTKKHSSSGSNNTPSTGEPVK